MTPEAIPSLTGLRGIAAFVVVMFHVALGAQLRLFSAGYLGVDAFFILSGFVLAHVHADKFNNWHPGIYISFLKARVARIYPLHLFMLCVVAAAISSLPWLRSSYIDADQRFGLSCFVASALLIQNWFHWMPGCWNTPSWALSALWFAYLIFPAVLFLTQCARRPMTSIFLAGLCLLGFSLVMLLKGVSSVDVTGTSGMVRMAAEFCCGCFLYRAVRTGLKRLPAIADIVAVIVLLASAVAGTDFICVFAIALIVLLAAQERGPIALVLATPLAVFLGEISYSVYLVHWIVLQVANRIAAKIMLEGIGFAIWNAGVIALILAISTVTYRFIEIPARAFGRKIGVPRAVAIANTDAI
jgi:peptidoglycan/LPS O-acetylase OafA/YrhL